MHSLCQIKQRLIPVGKEPARTLPYRHPRIRKVELMAIAAPEKMRLENKHLTGLELLIPLQLLAFILPHMTQNMCEELKYTSYVTSVNALPL
jgi:hypothetical protein